MEPRSKRRRLQSVLAGVFLATGSLLASTPEATEWDPVIRVFGPASDATLAEANLALADTFTLQGVQGIAPRRPVGGGFDWDHRGPRNDPEWSWFFNRHGYFTAAYQAYLRTHDDRYAEFIFATLDDWIVQHPDPGGLTFSAAWRPLEAARRILDSWTLIYLKLGNHPAFTPERRARFLTSIHAHGDQLRHHHALYGNHRITEMLALAQLSLVFTQDHDSTEWLRYSLDELDRSYTHQVYPDGAHKELSAHYQRVVALNYQRLLTLLESAGKRDLADAWRPRVKRLWSYFTAIMRPDGGNPLNNDSDQEDVVALLRANAPELVGDKAAALAKDAKTHWLPYAGQAVFRSHRGNSTLWAFFDTGPRGTDHDHADRLHFSASIGAREFLVDNGRYTYRPGPWRDYFAGPTGHNVVLLDGVGSDQGPRKVEAPDTLGRFFALDHVDVAYGDASFASGGNPRAADWRRIVVHLRGTGWIVVDRMVVFQPVTFTTLWHWHPSCDARPPDPVTGQVILNTTESLHLRVASSEAGGAWSVARGESDPVQGWHSDRFNFKTAAACTLYTQRAAQPVTHVWLMSPGGALGSAAPTLEVAFAADGPLVIRVRGHEADFTLHLDPAHPESLRSER